jgi:hypothetical protein
MKNMIAVITPTINAFIARARDNGFAVYASPTPNPIDATAFPKIGDTGFQYIPINSSTRLSAFTFSGYQFHGCEESDASPEFVILLKSRIR